MSDPVTTETLLTALGGIGSAVVGLALYMRKLQASFAQDALATKAATADVGVIERLERECKRLSEQNEKLAENLNKFQLQIMTFQTENQKLSFENNSLKEENLSLREEIMELRGEVSELSKTMMEIQARPPACMVCKHRMKAADSSPEV